MRTSAYAAIAGMILAAAANAGELKPVDGEAPLRAGWRVCTVGPNSVETLEREPVYKSANPLYMTMRIGSGEDDVVTVALDESKGTGKGYDILHVDANNNGDLTDGTPLKPNISKRAGSHSFGVDPLDITVKYADGSSIVLGVQLEIRGYESGRERRIKWTAAYHVAQHLEGRVDFGEKKNVLIGIYDSSDAWMDANGCFTDYGVDRIVIDVNGDGKLDEKKEDMPMSRVVVVDGRLWALSLERGTSASVSPFMGPTGRVRFVGNFEMGKTTAATVDSYAEVVSTNGYALKLRLGGDGGVVPEGGYRVSHAHIKMKDEDERLWESFFFTTNDVAVTSAKGAALRIGAPLRLEPEVQGTLALGRHVCVMPHVIGRGGEVYENLSPVSTRMQPTASFTDSEGIVATSGQMEYG